VSIYSVDISASTAQGEINAEKGSDIHGKDGASYGTSIAVIMAEIHTRRGNHGSSSIALEGSVQEFPNLFPHVDCLTSSRQKTGSVSKSHT
jgi:hypothetical protein